MALLTFVAIAAVTLGWFALPFVPAFMELRRKIPIQPLPIPRGDEGDIQHFAKRFREYVASEASAPGVGDTFEQTVGGLSTLSTFVAPRPLVVDRDWVCSGDIYATDSLYGWDGAVYRGVLANRDVVLGPRSLVLRWIHSVRTLRVGAASALPGRASATGSLCLAEGTSFGWLAAARIEFGSPDACRYTRRASRLTAARPEPPPRRIHGDLDIAPGSDIEEDLIVYGLVSVGSHSIVRRSIKAHGALHIGDRVSVLGSIVSRTDVIVSADCDIGGVVVAERSIRIGARSRIGAERTPSTVSAPTITMEPGAIAHGTVWARTAGSVGWEPDRDAAQQAPALEEARALDELREESLVEAAETATVDHLVPAAVARELEDAEVIPVEVAAHADAWKTDAPVAMNTAADSLAPVLFTVRGQSATIKCAFADADAIEVHGDVSGDLWAGGLLIIGEGARVSANVSAANIRVEGKFTGDLRATECLEIVSSGTVNGSINCDELVIERGGVFNGTAARSARPRAHR